MIRKRAEEYHYQFMQSGKMYYGVCENCTTERDALAYEKRIRETVKKLSEQTSVTALVENFKRELTGCTDILLADAFEKYLTKPAKRKAGVVRAKLNRQQWSDFVAFMNATYPDIKRMDSVTQNHAMEYVNYLLTQGRFISDVTFTVKGKRGEKIATYKRDGQLSASTVNAYHTTCQSVFNRLADDIGITKNPFDFVKADAESEKRDIFTPEELRIIGDNLDGFIKPLFIIGIFTGLTLGDVCLLEWRNIRGNWIIRKRNKTRADLEIPMLPPVAAFIEEQRYNTGNDAYVLPEHAAMYKSNPTGVSYRIKQFLKGLGIETTRATYGAKAASVKDFHSLRHTFAYIAGVYKIPANIVQSILGHMTPEMTKHYQEHATRADKEKFMNQLPDFLNSGDVKQIGVVEPERAELHKLVDTLPIEKIKKLLKELV